MIKYRFITALLLVIGLMTFGLGTGKGHAGEVPRIPKEQLKAEMGSPNLIILDVRIEPEWQESEYQIPGAIREAPTKVEEWINKYPKDKTLVLYCA